MEESVKRKESEGQPSSLRASRCRSGREGYFGRGRAELETTVAQDAHTRVDTQAGQPPSWVIGIYALSSSG
jgi:hypothetical protein